MSETDQERMWSEAVAKAKKECDAIMGDAVGGGFMEPKVAVHISTIFWLAKRLTPAPAIPGEAEAALDGLRDVIHRLADRDGRSLEEYVGRTHLGYLTTLQAVLRAALPPLPPEKE